MDIELGTTVYLQPLFLRQMMYALGLTQDQLVEEISNQLTFQLNSVREELKEVSKTTSLVEKIKPVPEIGIVYNMIGKIRNRSGGLQLSVLSNSRKIVASLKRYPYINEQNRKQLKEIIASQDLFNRPYHTGLDSRTVERLLNITAEVNTKNYSDKVHMVLDTYASFLSNSHNKKMFFDQRLTDSKRVLDVFFTIYGMHAKFDEINEVIEAILSLKDKTNIAEALKEICGDFSFYSQATLVSPNENRLEDMTKQDEKSGCKITGIDEFEGITTFHEDALAYIRSHIQFIKRDTPYVKEVVFTENPQILYAVVDDALKVIKKICGWKKIDEKADDYTRLVHEILLHGLHSNKETHDFLCDCFSYWREGVS